MTVELDASLVALSLFMAFQGSYVGLHLARQIGEARGIRHRRLIASSAFSLALAIWTMHFVGMLAVGLPYAADYLVLPTLLSFLVCVLVVGVAVFVVGSAAPSRNRILLAGLFMGAGILAMHYLGMVALHSRMHMTHDAALTAASAAIGVGAAGMALWLCFGDGAPRSVPGSAALLAFGISAMHYTAMSGTAFHMHELAAPDGQPALSPGLLAIVVSVVAFLVSGLFLLTLVPMPPEAAPAGTAPAEEPEAIAPSGAVQTTAEPVAAPDPAAAPQPLRYPAALPVEREGLKRSLDTARLVAVQAQAHYTQLFDGEEVWFCPLTISEVEARLDPAVFARVHRSHIVHLDRIATLRRSGDAGEASLATRVPYRVPVARSRTRWLKTQLQSRLVAAS
ncbi:MHYT domain-containing protein [Prosthecomicrobium sp. N25]|uniref:MHYT domain-containing protein n=1 Tax=Prosthecomicrobium sp. N25 TaxID=3129254 RepID=UPI0030785119